MPRESMSCEQFEMLIKSVVAAEEAASGLTGFTKRECRGEIIDLRDKLFELRKILLRAEPSHIEGGCKKGATIDVE